MRKNNYKNNKREDNNTEWLDELINEIDIRLVQARRRHN
tara:strand:- start:514 stop:630 length:117 start_codon:yes stop_codon:yes gene_type:complete